MADIQLEVVRFALALHLSMDREHIEPEDRLEADLGLDPLDLVLVVLRLEEIENAEFPVAELESVVTVADLVAVVRAWSQPDRAATLPPPPPASYRPAARHASGIRPIPSSAVIRFNRAANG
jgi:acyl carrier protein